MSVATSEQDLDRTAVLELILQEWTQSQLRGKKSTPRTCTNEVTSNECKGLVQLFLYKKRKTKLTIVISHQPRSTSADSLFKFSNYIQLFSVPYCIYMFVSCNFFIYTYIFAIIYIHIYTITHNAFRSQRILILSPNGTILRVP